MSDYAAELAYIESLSPLERSIYFRSQSVRSEESWLQFMIDSNQFYQEFFEWCVMKSKQAVIDYQQTGDKVALGRAESFAELASNAKVNRYTIKDIRKQRERVQWEKRKLASLTKQQSEPLRTSLENSET